MEKDKWLNVGPGEAKEGGEKKGRKMLVKRERIGEKTAKLGFAGYNKDGDIGVIM